MRLKTSPLLFLVKNLFPYESLSCGLLPGPTSPQQDRHEKGVGGRKTHQEQLAAWFYYYRNGSTAFPHLSLTPAMLWDCRELCFRISSRDFRSWWPSQAVALSSPMLLQACVPSLFLTRGEIFSFSLIEQTNLKAQRFQRWRQLIPNRATTRDWFRFSVLHIYDAGCRGPAAPGGLFQS